jgi:methionyl-tRNA formyltransferase
MRLLFLGTRCPFSLAVLDTLLGAGVEPCIIAVPGPPGAPTRRLEAPPLIGLPLAGRYAERSITTTAWERGTPVLELGALDTPDTLAALASFEPDVACVACFPRLIPPGLLGVPRHGFLNVHPSLLPAHRGPEPLFWTLRAGDPAGVSVHRMDAGFDTGPIAAQQAVALPDGISGAEAERRCAEAGGRLLAATLRALAKGTLALRPQPPGGSYEPRPSPADFALDTGWPARRAFNFMRGTGEWGLPYPVEAGGERLLLAGALAFDAEGRLPAPYVREGGRIAVQFTPGVLLSLEA